MSNLKFGVKTDQGGYTFEDLKKVWMAAEDLGYDSAWVYDHFYALGNNQNPCLEAWTTLSALAASTKRLKIGTMVTSVSYRSPSLLAKMATTVDHISHGRLLLGLGAGWYEEEYKAYGYEFLDQRTRVRQLKEALIVIRKLWTEDKATFNGEFYSLTDAINLPKPLQKPYPKILVGIKHGKKTLPYFAVRYADGFNVTTGSFEECRDIMQAVKGYCERYGKRADDLICSWQGFILIGQNRSELDRMLERAAKERGKSPQEFKKEATERGSIIGNPDDCVKQLNRFKEIDINQFFLRFSDDTSIRTLETFRDNVIPKLR